MPCNGLTITTGHCPLLECEHRQVEKRDANTFYSYIRRMICLGKFMYECSFNNPTGKTSSAKNMNEIYIYILHIQHLMSFRVHLALGKSTKTTVIDYTHQRQSNLHDPLVALTAPA